MGLDLSNVDWECIRTRPKLFTAKMDNAKGEYSNTQFDFLGYTFRRRLVKNRKRNSMFVNFTPAVSNSALKSMRQTTRNLNYRNRTNLSLEDIARLHNPILRGWLQYYGKFYPSALYAVLRHFNRTLVAWADEEVQTIERPQDAGEPFSQKYCREKPALVCALATRNGR